MLEQGAEGGGGSGIAVFVGGQACFDGTAHNIRFDLESAEVAEDPEGRR